MTTAPLRGAPAPTAEVLPSVTAMANPGAPVEAV